MSDQLATINTVPATQPASSLPAVPWRDPQTVSPVELALYIQQLERACLDNPRSADLRTCLGMAYAVNYDVYKSMDILEEATAIDPEHFWAQLKYAELHYRLRALPRAEEETLKAVDLAQNPWQLSVARKQLQEIRTLQHESVRNVNWTKPLTAPVVVLSLMFMVLFVVMMWK
jgi:tetratricopeptide (TPR) repeat protein